MESPDFDKIIKLLEIKSSNFIGSFSVKNIKYSSDVDLEEFVETDLSFDNILEKFKIKFLEVRNDKNMYMMDFKCGWYRGLPVRWDYTALSEGFKMIGDYKFYFITALQMRSIIKMDVVGLVNGIFTEFSNNYYFNFPNEKGRGVISTKPKIPTKSDELARDALRHIFLQEFQTLYGERRYFKSLKRLYSYYKIYDTKYNKHMLKVLVGFFNSKIGFFNHQLSNLSIIIDLINNKIVELDKFDIINNIQIIRNNFYNTKFKNLLINSKNVKDMEFDEILNNLKEVSELIFNETNKETMKFMKKNIDFEIIFGL